MFPWAQIDTVLLDMDGTLLDLHFDNYFWLSLVPDTISVQRNISRSEAQQLVQRAYLRVEGTLQWYCLDYWAQELRLDILALHLSITDKIRLRQDTVPFLLALQQAGKRRILLTNAHPHSLQLKLQHTHLDQYLDVVLSSHQLGVPKESPLFWQQVFARFQLQPARCLFVDDNENILLAAREAGIQHLLGINNPDSKRPNTRFTHFPSISDYQLLTQGLAVSTP
ncbi:GMP/IMP nucleotidase [Shewanella fodinae]|uniref:GMP/IMP nucleotidase n=1 Tax=Shewanella fodinae TaxID=552357 RepID=UPI00167A6E44|nr:GMP/IMP nucleotidase [Shewanella fodinae]MCL2906767.1 GMP/IMP nucleotidase [Shewanella fodinae]GGZ02556.1 nucleotidase [Shewanella fodinae]